MNIIFFNTWATWAVEGGMSSQKVFINDDVDHAYSNVMMKMFWWYDYDQDDQDNYDQVDDNDMMIWWWLYIMYILIHKYMSSISRHVK